MAEIDTATQQNASLAQNSDVLSEKLRESADGLSRSAKSLDIFLSGSELKRSA